MPVYLLGTILFVLNSFLEGDPSGLDFSGIVSALTGAVSAQQLITYFAAIIGAGIGLYVAYVVVRKAVKAFTSAIRGGAPRI